MGQQAAFESLSPAFNVGSGLAGQYPSSLVDLPLLLRMMGTP